MHAYSFLTHCTAGEPKDHDLSHAGAVRLVVDGSLNTPGLCSIVVVVIVAKEKALRAKIIQHLSKEPWGSLEPEQFCSHQYLKINR